MTAGSTAVETSTASTGSDVLAGATSLYDVVVKRIITETGCSMAEAVVAITFIKDMATKARLGLRGGEVGTHHLTGSEMDMVGYVIMDKVLPHGSTAAEGSAHAGIQTLVLEADECALTHDNPTGQPEDCVVTVSILRAG